MTSVNLQKRLLIHLKPFDFTSDEDFDLLELAKTTRKNSQETDTKLIIETIRKHRKYSM